MHCHLSIPAWGTLNINEIRQVMVAPSASATNSGSEDFFFFPPTFWSLLHPPGTLCQVPEIQDL